MEYQRPDGERTAYEFGKMHMDWALLMQYYPRLCLMAPRNHLKSTVAKAFAFWQMFKVDRNQHVDMLYLGFKVGLAIEHVEDLLRWIRANSYCRFWRDLKPYGRTMIDYLVDYGDGVVGEASLKGEGIGAATRGRHPKVTICDDILSDFSNPLDSAELQRINRVFKQSIMSLPSNQDDPLMVVGTPQSYDDILYELANAEDWLWLQYPAVIDEANKVVQWPEKYDYVRLKKKQKEIGIDAFECEYQLVPVNVANQWFSRDDILNVIDPDLSMWRLAVEFDKGDLATYGGVDVGKLVHPTHVSVLLELPNGTLVQVYSRFLDRVKYNEQVNVLNRIAECFKLSKGYFDDTFNALDDRGLDPVWRGRTFTRKRKADMATGFSKRVFAGPKDPGIILLNDLRQLNQVTVVDKELKAATTVEGHGDAFWSNGLAIKAADDGPTLTTIGVLSTLKPARIRAT